MYIFIYLLMVFFITLLYREPTLIRITHLIPFYVYQKGNHLIWLIGWDIDSTTEVIYHLYTNEPENLPSKRIQYKYDNRGFREGSEKEQGRIGHYRIFSDIIPNEYNVTAVIVGFNTEGTIIWTECFRTNYPY